MRFSLRTLLIVVSLSGFLGAAYLHWPRESGPVSTDEFHWRDYSVGIVDQSHNGNLRHHGHTYGGGTYVELREGAHTPGTTGGWYYLVGIQLPAGIEQNDEFDLSPAATGRHLEAVGEFERLGFLRPGEFVAFYFGNPIGACMKCEDANSTGTLTVVSMTREQVEFELKLHAEIPDSCDVDIDRRFTLPREYRRTIPCTGVGLARFHKWTINLLVPVTGTVPRSGVSDRTKSLQPASDF